MNLMEILENSILLEAIKINNGDEAYELIKNNKLGVKLDPTYKTADKSIIPYLDKAINSVGLNDASFAIQLLVNKVPANQLKEVVNSDSFKQIVSCKNKPWAKQIPEYKEIIDFSFKNKYDSVKWKKIGETLKKESENHGKATKGSGNLKDVKELYNDGTWTLQVPTSWDGAKAASFYGKRDEKPITTQWCTRAEKVYYDKYTENNTKPLYIIRNWENGKAYQMSIRGTKVDFLDQNDTKGDEITKGDFSSIPNGLLKKIPYGNGESMLDFKNGLNDAKNELDEYKKGLKKVRENSKIKDPANTNHISKARWGSPEKVTKDISKCPFLNYVNINPAKIVNPLETENGYASANFPEKIKLGNNSKSWKSGFITGDRVKKFKNNGRSVKYYYNNNPNNFVLITAGPNKNIKNEKYKNIQSLEKSILSKEAKSATRYKVQTFINNRETKTPEYDDFDGEWMLDNDFNNNYAFLVDIALKDFGINKTFERNKEENKNMKEEVLNTLTSSIENEIRPLLKQVSPEETFFAETTNENINYNKGGFIIKNIAIRIKNNTNDKCIILYSLESPNKTVLAKPSDIFIEPVYFGREIDNKIGIENFKTKISNALNKAYKKYTLAMVKNKNFKNERINQRSKEEQNKNLSGKKTIDRLQYEEFVPNYFPY